jgi:Ser/Thr protein kinase RdoA (MazF antagonist)
MRGSVLDRYGVTAADLLGSGGEAEVYALGTDRVLRLHRHEAARYTEQIGELYAQLDRGAVPYALPEVLEVHGDGEVSWSIERRLPGRSFDQVLGELRGQARAGALRAYLDGAAMFSALGRPPGWAGGCGELFTAERLRADRWGDLVAQRLLLQAEQARELVAPHLAGFDDAVRAIVEEARGTGSEGAPSLVHGDWFPGNVLVGDDLEVSAAIDLGWLTVVGDPDHDVAAAAVFCEVHPWLRPGDREVLVAAAERHLGPGAAERIDRARRAEQLRFAFVAEDEHLHRWCLDGLRTVAEGAA